MNTEYEYALGQNIRTLRLKRGLSQEQLAAQLQTRGCDITRSALAKMEVGQRHIYPDELKLPHDLLEASYEELFIYPATALKKFFEKSQFSSLQTGTPVVFS